MARNTQVTMDDFELLKVIGKGTYGKVLLVKKTDTQQYFAMKILKKSFIAHKNQIEHTKTERNILAKIKHPFIVKMHYAFHNKKKLYFVLDYCSGGELFFHLSNARQFDEGRARFYAACVVLALEHLHSEGIVYRDLKPENILIDSQGYAKLTDFGLSKENVTDNFSAKTFCGTPEYLAPEILLKTGHGKCVDFWNLGCLIYEMLTGLPPFYVQNKQEVYRRILNEDPRYPEYLSPVARHLIQGLLMKDPNQRIGIQEIKSHLWFYGMNWTGLYNKSLQAPFLPVTNSQDDVRYFSQEFTRSPPRESLLMVPEASASPSSFSPTYSGFSFQGSPNEKDLQNLEFTLQEDTQFVI
mmetsp:Transcript_642/g.1042  ORF Transcript_642/g.1042 Transcript_642/m.1042 type:complete len:354 (-) Transcript_642:1142-2203(-)